jgi:predicted transcriptional regulator
VREPLDAGTLTELTAAIVAAYVTHHPVAAADVPALIDAVARRLVRLAPEEGVAAAQAPTRREPAVAVRRSVTPEHLTCLACGRRVSTLRRHLQAAHGLTPAGYRAAFGLRGDYPMVAPAHAARRAELARRSGLGRARGAPASAPARPRGGRGATLRLPGAMAPVAMEGARRS